MNASNWPLVIVESPFAGDMAANVEYLKKCCLDCLARQEVPFASHGFFTHFLDESKPEDRELGLTAGYAFWSSAIKIVFYLDRGMSNGMKQARERALMQGHFMEMRYLEKRD